MSAGRPVPRPQARADAKERIVVLKVVVLVKYTPDLTGTVRFADDGTVDRDAVEGQLSELDEYAAEQALRISENGGAEVVYVTMGPAAAAGALRKALSMGGDRAVHVLDDALHGSDAIATSAVLAEAVRKVGHDLVVCGMASTDAGMGVVPSMVAERLGVPQLTYARELTLAGDEVRIERETDAAVETVVAPLPALVSVTDRSGDPRYPSFKGIMAAKKKPVETWTLADLGPDTGGTGLSAARSATRSITARPPRQAGPRVTDEGEGQVALADFLASRKFI
ncbi:electron transfer flavoprotein subunit beta/FixA family protein [Sphaerisporangium rubeum]|uniref:electron transfer flavoprotein subunit beta/FixA family protein n=1 Tax=Sphaerisporangium rubeum TaxID=321317 RepID=UPI0031B582CC